MTPAESPDHPSLFRRLRPLALGLFAGLLAGVVMLVFMAFLRLFFYVATPTEMIFDRAFPFMTVDFFIDALVKSGSYSALKLNGVYGALIGQLVAAGAGGVVYARFVNWRAKPDHQTAACTLIDPRGWLLIVPGVFAVWVLFAALLWPQLLTNYHGRPPGMALVITSLGMLASFAVCGVGIMWFYGLLTTSPRLAANADDEPPTAGLTRRRFLAGGFGALAAVAFGGLLHRLFKLGTFGYDGTQYGGPEVVKITPERQVLSGHQKPRGPRRGASHLALRHRRQRRVAARLDLRRTDRLPCRGTGNHPTVHLLRSRQRVDLQCVLERACPCPRCWPWSSPRRNCAAVLFHAADGLLRDLSDVQGNRK